MNTEPTEKSKYQKTQKKPRTPDSQQRTIESSELFGKQRQLLIKHGEQTYQLQITRQNKLILTK